MLTEQLSMFMALLPWEGVVRWHPLWFNMIHQLMARSAARQIIVTITVSSAASKPISLHINASFRAQRKYIRETI